MTGAQLIAREREQQFLREGFTDNRDDQMEKGELVSAARCYLDANIITTLSLLKHWPFNPLSFKNKGPISNLVRAGALIAAEIDRLQRLEKNPKPSNVDGPPIGLVMPVLYARPAANMPTGQWLSATEANQVDQTTHLNETDYQAMVDSAILELQEPTTNSLMGAAGLAPEISAPPPPENPAVNTEPNHDPPF